MSTWNFQSFKLNAERREAQRAAGRLRRQRQKEGLPPRPRGRPCKAARAQGLVLNLLLFNYNSFRLELDDKNNLMIKIMNILGIKLHRLKKTSNNA